ncbi:polysaccharide biosynthesis tyrosine autokinase [Ornithinimicrobium sp. W1679]|uniref:polysaccharide biosynthesis tyrosine autokinase n=1 Tax=Ornithinimicrobium sp. W1679 TaxID=3418770 RepID=UPI003CF3469E
MNFSDYARAAQRRWWIVVVLLTVGLLLATAVNYFTTPLYRAQAELYVSTVSGGSSADLAQGSTFTQRQVASYADVATTPYVLRPVIEELGLDTTPRLLARQVAVSAAENTVIIGIAVTDTDPDRALDIARSVSAQLVDTLSVLDQVDADSPGPVKATLVTPAEVGSAPVEPQIVRNLALGSVLGLLLGLAAAILRDRTDTSIRSREDTQAVTDTPLLGTIAFDSDAARLPSTVLDRPHHPLSEAFRVVRTNLQFVNAGDPPRSLVLTSSLPGEGKTTVTTHLALTLAARNKRVCVIEADLRRPRLLRFLGLEGAAGLTNVLINEASLEEMLQPFGDTGVTVLGSGPLPPNPAELLASDNMRALINDAESKFDIVLIDAPPLLPVTDAAVLTELCDGALVVVGAGVIEREHLSASVTRLAQAQGSLLGLILNKVDSRGTTSYDAYSGYYTPDGHTQTSRRAGRRRRPRTRRFVGRSTDGPQAQLG